MNSWRRGRSAVKAGSANFMAGAGPFLGLLFFKNTIVAKSGRPSQKFVEGVRCTNFLSDKLKQSWCTLSRSHPAVSLLVRIIYASCLRRCRCSAALFGGVKLSETKPSMLRAHEDLRASSSYRDHERHQALRRLFLHVGCARTRCDEICGAGLTSHLGNAECSDHFRATLLRKS